MNKRRGATTNALLDDRLALLMDKANREALAACKVDDVVRKRNLEYILGRGMSVTFDE